MSDGAKSDFQFPIDRYELRLSGSGGQGMMLAALLLCEAIGTDPRLNVIQTKSYGPEARGGACKADIVVSSSEIYYPKPIKLDLLLAMTQESMDKYYPNLKAEGILIIDETLISHPPQSVHFAVPFTRLAREEVGNVMVANVISLGAIAAITGIVTHEALANAVLMRAPKGSEEKNRLALDIGFREGSQRRDQQQCENLIAFPFSQPVKNAVVGGGK